MDTGDVAILVRHSVHRHIPHDSLVFAVSIPHRRPVSPGARKNYVFTCEYAT